MGQNPNKSSKTYREVLERTRKEGKIEMRDGVECVQTSDGELIPLDEADLCHTQDAMKWWNETGKYWGPKHDKIRDFMTDPNNYVLGKAGPNRSAGAKLKGVGYDAPDPRPDGPP
jgi:hypothetical protein